MMFIYWIFGEIKKKKKWMDEWRREAIQDFAVVVILLFIWNKKYYFWFVEWIVIPKIRWFLKKEKWDELYTRQRNNNNFKNL